MIINSLTFWTLIAGLLAFIAKFFFPAFPLDTEGLLAVILFVLGLVNIVPQVRFMGATFSDILKSLPFWTMISGLIWFVVHFYLPTFPLDSTGVLAFITFLLGLFNITPELRMRSKIK